MKVLVTGANGHLGNNLVKLLVNEGYKVRAGVRNVEDKRPFQGYNSVEIVPFDLLNPEAIDNAIRGMDIVFQVAAVFKFWAKDQQSEIYHPNVQGTKNVMEFCLKHRVNKVVYVSSVAALNMSVIPMSPQHGYNTIRLKPYYNSKTDSEQIALQYGAEHDLDVVSVLPSAMIGSELYRMTDSNNLLNLVMNGKIFIDTSFYTNYIDVKDVAKICVRASELGKKGERYIAANTTALSFNEVIEIANTAFPELKLKYPKKASRRFLMANAQLMELGSKLTGKAPLLQTSDVKMFYNLRQDFDISKTIHHLGVVPKAPHLAIREAMIYLRHWKP